MKMEEIVALSALQHAALQRAGATFSYTHAMQDGSIIARAPVWLCDMIKSRALDRTTGPTGQNAWFFSHMLERHGLVRLEALWRLHGNATSFRAQLTRDAFSETIEQLHAEIDRLQQDPDVAR